jgi:ribosome-binding protein aMBF1 (putative translation factor)
MKRNFHPETEVLKLAAENPFMFWSDGAKDLREKLVQLLREHYERVKHDTVMQVSCLFRWILTWPGLIDRPSGFEWVMKEFEVALSLRSWFPSYDKQFWEAVDVVKGEARSGAPSKLMRDYIRASMVRHLMSPKGGKKSKAVEAVSEWENEKNIDGNQADVRGIWRSLKKVKTDIQRRTDPSKWDIKVKVPDKMVGRSFLVGTRLNEFREARGLSQLELSQQGGIDVEYLSEIETGKSFPPFGILTKLAEALHVELEDFFQFAHEGVKGKTIKDGKTPNRTGKKRRSIL